VTSVGLLAQVPLTALLAVPIGRPQSAVGSRESQSSVSVVSPGSLSASTKRRSCHGTELCDTK
jgi:hypothetical protein